MGEDEVVGFAMARYVFKAVHRCILYYKLDRVWVLSKGLELPVCLLSVSDITTSSRLIIISLARTGTKIASRK